MLRWIQYRKRRRESLYRVSCPESRACRPPAVLLLGGTPCQHLPFSKNFFLFGINRYRRALSPLAGTDPASNVFKPCVAVGMVRALSSLAITLQRVSERTKNLGNLHSAHCVSLRAKLLLKVG